MDKTDPVCGMKGHIKAHGHYFCSRKCVEKYEKKGCCEPVGKPWYKNKLLYLVIFTFLLYVFSYFYFEPLFEALFDYLMLIWWAILLGIIIGGIIDHAVPDEYIQKMLATHRKRNILLAVIFGFLMSACSHGILAIAMELYKKGASTSSTVAFLLASPWANLPLTILLFGFFGAKALLLVASAIIIAIITGLVYMVLEKKGLVECDKCDAQGNAKQQKKFSIMADIRKRWAKYNLTWGQLRADLKGIYRGSASLSQMVLWWIIIGMVIASLARVFISAEVFQQYMGPTILGIVVTLVIATIIEVCSEGSSPMAFEIYNQTGAFGNSFVFLMAGVATDYTEIGLIWQNIGRKAAIWLPVITVPQIFLLGLLFNLI